MSSVAEPLISSEELGKISLPADSAYNLPRSAYTSKEIFELERDHIFATNWTNVAHVSQIPELGDYLSVEVCGYALLVTRHTDGGVRVMSRVCQHKGTLIAEGKGNARLFVCPFHAWSYGLDGELIAAPLMDEAKNFDRKDCRLPQIKSEIWHGFVFVNLSGDAEPLGPKLKGLSTRLANWGMAELVPAHETFFYRQAQNWKINAESFLEAYHHLGAHVKTFQPTYPAANSYPIESDGNYSILSFGEAQGGSAKNIDGGDSIPFIESLTDKERLEPMVAFVWPSLLLGIGPDQIAYYRIMPTAAGSHDVWIDNLMERSTAADPQYREAIDTRIHWATEVVHETDDQPVFERCYAGMQSGMYTQGRLAVPYERCIWEFNQWWAAQLGERVLQT